MRLLVCAGGTGGGVYPALAVVQARKNNPADEILWVGSENGMEGDMVRQAGLNYRAIPAAGLHGVGWRALPANLWKLLRGFFASIKILMDFKPEVLFFTGGYIAAPMALAGIALPSVVFVPDIEPGLALKLLCRFASVIAVVCEESKAYMPKKRRVAVCGYPTRGGLTRWTREEGRAYFDLASTRPMIFIYGGSKGARSINRAVKANLEKLLACAQIVHITGETDWEECQREWRELPPERSQNYRIYPFLREEMGAAFAAADLVISRAGASVLGELPLFGLPAILVPYPYAWRYQKVNADYLVQRGAAIMIADQNLGAELGDAAAGLLNERERLNDMKKNIARLAEPYAAGAIAALLDEHAEKYRREQLKNRKRWRRS